MTKELMRMGDHTIEMELGPVGFDWAWDKKFKSLAFFWIRRTQIINIIHITVLSLKLRWPPFKWVTAYNDTDFDED